MYLQLHIYLIYRDHYCSSCVVVTLLLRGRRGRVRMVVEFTTTYAISAYHHWCFWVRITIRARCTALCDQVCQWLVTGWWFSLGPPVSSTNKTDCHDITESGINHHQTNNRSGWDVQHYVIKFVRDLQTIKLTATINWNIVESGIKHHETKPHFS